MLDKKTYKLLKFISANPGCKFSVTPHKRTLCPFVSSKLKYSTNEDLVEALLLLHNLNFISIKMKTSSIDKSFDYLKTLDWDDSFSLCNPFYVLPQGLAYIQQKRQQFFTFLIPYTLTTVIALLSLISNLIQ